MTQDSNTDHCWAPVLDHGGQVPVYMPVDPKAQPFRAIATTKGEHLVLHFQCCRCGQRGVRRFESKAVPEHGDHRPHYDLPEVEPLPDGPCSGAK